MDENIYTTSRIAEELNISVSTVQRLIRSLNARLKENGRPTIEKKDYGRNNGGSYQLTEDQFQAVKREFKSKDVAQQYNALFKVTKECGEHLSRAMRGKDLTPADLACIQNRDFRTIATWVNAFMEEDGIDSALMNSIKCLVESSIKRFDEQNTIRKRETK